MKIRPSENIKLLIVDDDALHLQLLSTILAEPGCVIFTAVSGKQCYEVAEQVKPDIIILDVSLKDDNGYTICKALKGNTEYGDGLILLYSGINVSSSDIQAGLAAGADGYLKKGMPNHELKLWIQTYRRLRLSEQKKKYNEAHLVKAQKIASMGSWEMDTVTGECEWSDEFFRICGWEPGSLEPTAEIGFSIIHPEDRAKAREAVHRAISTYGDYHFEKRILRPDGEIRHIIADGKVVTPAEGENVRMVGTFHDITDRKKIEKEVQFQASVLESVKEAIIATDSEFNILYWNHAAEDLYGWPSAEVLGKQFGDIVPTEYIGTDKDLVMSYFMKNPGWEGEVIQRNKAGEEMCIQSSVTPMFNETGTLAYAVAANRNITSLKKTESELQRLAQHLQDIREEQSAHLAREIHDDLGQSLAGLDLLTKSMQDELAESGLATKKSVFRLTEIRKELNNAVKKVRTIVTDLHPAMMDLADLQDAVKWVISQFKKKSDIRFGFHCPEQPIILELPVQLAAVRVLQEAVTNIIKHAKASEVVIKVLLDEKLLIISVEDDGTGFDVNSLQDNRGFGLISMRERALFCGGALELKSIQKKGTQVILKIPVQ